MAKKLPDVQRKRPDRGRALFYTRDSGGKSEMTPGQYVRWAARECATLGLAFNGTEEQIQLMIDRHCAAEGDIFQDQDVAGNILSRPGLEAILREIERDRTISHVFIPRPDRLARPDEIADGIKLEMRFRQEQGITLVFQDRHAPPIPRGEKVPLQDLVIAAVQYDYAEKFRHDLAFKTLTCRAKYGLLRVLVRDDGTPIRPLDEGEYVRTKGQHVMWLPDNSARWDTRCRIVRALFKTPASQLARQLTRDGVPSPDAGRMRKDNGIKHIVSGVWCQSTIVDIGRDPINIALYEYGRRSMGDRFRYSPEGPRKLSEGDFGDDNKPKVIENPRSQRVRTQIAIQPLLTLDEYNQLQQILDQRAGTQRAKPRSRTPGKNPLGARVFDCACGWPMYRVPRSNSFRYVCGLYQQSHAAQCEHNHVDGPLATALVLSCMRQRVLVPNLLSKLENRLRSIAAREGSSDRASDDLKNKVNECERSKQQLDVVAHNMAVAANHTQRAAIAAIFDELTERHHVLENELVVLKKTAARKPDVEADIAAALKVIHRLSGLANDPSNLEAVSEAFRLVNARLFLHFKGIADGKRVLRKPAGGVVTFGDAPPPIKIYDGPTGRKYLAAPKGGTDGLKEKPSMESNSSFNGTEGTSSGNVDRGDRIRTCGLLVPNQTLYQAELRPGCIVSDVRR